MTSAKPSSTIISPQDGPPATGAARPGSRKGEDRRRATHADELAASYGFEAIADSEKQPRVDAVFHKVAERYDAMNDLMSGGMHRLWKDAMVARLSPPSRPGRGWRTLDVAGGTGDIAFRIVEASRRTAHATVFDINASMLEVGRRRAEQRGLSAHVDFVEGDAQELPFEDNSFDAYTIAFGIRNVPHIDRALAEAFRVLRHGGRFLCLEFSEVDIPVLDRFYEEWSMRAIPSIGKLIVGDAEPYRYLVESVRKFPDQRRFAAMIEQAGFSRVRFDNFTGGIAALHGGWKL